MKKIYFWGFLLGCSVILRGQTESTAGGLSDARRAMSEFQSKNPTDDLEKKSLERQGQLKKVTKDIRFKMLVRRKDDPDLTTDYEWATKPVATTVAPQVVYPYPLLAAKTSGKATVRFRINHEGRVDLTAVLETTNPEFGRAAQAAIETMAFTPAKKKDGSPALVLCDADFDFKPDGSGDVLVTAGAKDMLKTIKKNPAAVIPVAELDTAPRPINPASPVYPTTLVRQGLTGSAEIEFLIEENGRVVLPRVLTATAEEFGYAAAQAVSGWQFPPPTKKGRPVTTRARIEIEFAPAIKPAG